MIRKISISRTVTKVKPPQDCASQVDTATQTDPESNSEEITCCLQDNNKVTQIFTSKSYDGNNISTFFEKTGVSKTKLRLQKALQVRQSKATPTDVNTEPYDPGSPELFHDIFCSANGKSTQTNPESQLQSKVIDVAKQKTASKGKIRCWMHLNHMLNCDTETCQSYKTFHNHFLQAGRVTADGLILIKPASQGVGGYNVGLLLLLCPRLTRCVTCSSFVRHLMCIERSCKCNSYEDLKDIFVYVAHFIEDHPLPGKFHHSVLDAVEDLAVMLSKNVDELFLKCLSEMKAKINAMKAEIKDAENGKGQAVTHLTVVLDIIKDRAKEFIQKCMPCGNSSAQAQLNDMLDEDLVEVFDELNSAGIMSIEHVNYLIVDQADELHMRALNFIGEYIAKDPFDAGTVPITGECNDEIGEARKKFKKIVFDLIAHLCEYKNEIREKKWDTLILQHARHCSHIDWYKLDMLDQERFSRMENALSTFGTLVPDIFHPPKPVPLSLLSVPPTVSQRIEGHPLNCYMCTTLDSAYHELPEFADLIIPEFCKLHREPSNCSPDTPETSRPQNTRKNRKICPCKENLTTKQLRGIQKDFIGNQSSDEAPDRSLCTTYCKDLAKVFDSNLVHVGSEDNRYIRTVWVDTKHSLKDSVRNPLALRRHGLYPDEDWEAVFCNRLNAIFPLKDKQQAKPQTAFKWSQEHTYKVYKIK